MENITKGELAHNFVEAMVQTATHFSIFGIEEINQNKDYSDLTTAISERIPEDKIKEYTKLLESFCYGIGNEKAFRFNKIN